MENLNKKLQELKEEGRIKRYTSIQSGVAEDKSGRLLMVEDVVKYLEYCTDDDEQTNNRINNLIVNLTNEKK